MKKFLSLVLALVMTMSLVTVSAGAADFKDSKSIEYVEAVEVLDLIGVLEGYPDGSFQPKTVLTRAQAATIIAKLILTPELATELAVEVAPFADVPANHWAAAYIAEGVEQGILAGMGDGTFAPDAQLTGYQFLKMLFVALGYDATIEGLTGAYYTTGVTKLNKELKLTEGNDKFVGKNPVTREEAALYVWNAMNAEPVNYGDNSGLTIKVEGVVIETNGSTEAAPSGEAKWVDSYELKMYDGKDAEDDFGRAGYFWFIDENAKGYDKKDEKTATISEAATYVLVAEKAYKANEMAKLLEDNDIEDIEVIDFDEAIAVGTVVELWVEDEAVETVLTYTYEVDFVAEDGVVEADDDDESDDYEHGISTYYTLVERDETYVDAFECDDDDCTFCEDLIAIGEWEEGDAILFTVNEDGEDVEFAAAESFKGEISSKKGTYVKVDGDKYFTAVAIDFDKDYTFYVDANGIIIEAVEIADADKDEDRETEYVYVLDSQFKYEGAEDADLLNEAEEESLTYKVKYMTIDGDVVKADYAVFEKEVEDDEYALYVEFLGKDVAAADLGAKHEDLEGWYEAAFEGDEIVLVKKVAVKTEFAVSDAREWADGLRANSDTELVLLDEDGVYETYTGRTNMPEMTLENAVVVTEKKTVVAIYNYAEEYEPEAVAPVVGMFKELGENVAADEIEATFVVAGAEETYVIAAETELVKGGLYVVTEAADEDELTVVVALADSAINYIEGTVDFIDGDYFEVGDADLEKAEECAVYQFNKAGDKLSKGTLSTGKKVVVILDSEGDAAEIFQYKA